MKDRASSVIVGVADNNLTRGGHILHEQEYNTGDGIQAIPDEVRGEIRGQPGQPEVQQEPVLHLLLESPLGWNCTVSGLPVPAATPPSQPAHRGSAEADPGHAPEKSPPWHGGAVAPPASERVRPSPGEPVPCHEEAGAVPAGGEEAGLQAQAL